MLPNKIQQTSAIKKILLSFVIYLVYLLVDYFLSMIKGILGNLMVLIFITIMSLLIFKYVKTFKILKDDAKPKTPIINVIFLTLIILFFTIIVHPISNIKTIFSSSLLNIANCLVIALSAGIFEEFLVRLLLFDGFSQLLKNKKYSLLQASIYSSIIFGLFHLSNLSYQSFNTTFQQIFYAIAIGLMFCFIRLKTNGIWTCVLIHSLVDFQPNINSSGSSSSWAVLSLAFIPIILISSLCIYEFNKKIKLN